MLDANSTAVNWGWSEPTDEIIKQAQVCVDVRSLELGTGDLICHLNILSQDQLSDLNEKSRSMQDHPQYYDAILNAADGDIRDTLTTSKNRVMAIKRGMQLITSLNDDVAIHPEMMKSGSILYSECKKLKALLCIVQDTTPVLVFPELNSVFMSFVMSAGSESKLHQALGPKQTVALAASEEFIQAAYLSIESDSSDHDLQSSSTMVHRTLMSAGDEPADIAKRRLAKVIEHALTLKATDIHIDPSEESSAVPITIRVFGEMNKVDSGLYFSRDEYMHVKNFLSRTSNATKNDQAITDRADGRFTYIFNKQTIEVRAAFMNIGIELSLTNSEIAIRLRLLPKETGVIDLAEKRFPQNVIQHMSNAMLPESGLVLVTGPTGSGKSTALFGMVELHRLLYGDKKARMSLEDPIERFVPGIKQFQIRRFGNISENETWMNYLRQVVRMDPDFILMGEIRDEETAKMATQQAVTGHKSLSTMHASNTVEAVGRLMNMMSTTDYRVMLVNSISHIFGQRLMPEVCPSCGSVEQLTESQVAAAKFFLEKRLIDDIEVPTSAIVQSDTGCAACKYVGRVGVLPVHEVLFMDSEAKSLALRGNYDDLTQLRAKRIETLERATMDLIVAGKTPLSSLFAI